MDLLKLLSTDLLFVCVWFTLGWNYETYNTVRINCAVTSVSFHTCSAQPGLKTVDTLKIESITETQKLVRGTESTANWTAEQEKWLYNL